MIVHEGQNYILPLGMMISRPDKPTLGVVIPCYNEGDVIPLLQTTLTNFADSLSCHVNMLFIDDGSTDNTFPQLEAWCEKDDRVACIRFSRNFGHQMAVSAGLKHTRGDVIAVMDADLQDPPEAILPMLDKWHENYDVVYGIRRKRKEGIILRFAYAAFYRLLKKVSNIEMPMDAGDFSIMDRKVVDYINSMPEHHRFVRGMRGWIGFRQIGVPYERKARAAGAPKYDLHRLINLAINGMVSFSTMPLRLASWLGVAASGIGFILALWAIFAALFLSKTPSGWASLAVMLLFFGGIQLVVLGIMGEYVGRIFEEVKNRPHFIVEQSSGWIQTASSTPKKHTTTI